MVKIQKNQKVKNSITPAQRDEGRMVNTPKLNSFAGTILLATAILLYVVSLFFVTLSMDKNTDLMYGGLTLFLGGAAALFNKNPAWFANFFIIYIFICYHERHKTLIVSTILIVLLSMTTFLLYDIAMLVGGGDEHIPVLGYGWGAVLWFTSIYLTVIAVGLRLIGIASLEENISTQQKKKKQGKWLFRLGMLLLVTHTLCVTTKSIWDQTQASTWEKERFGQTKTLYKRGWVCTKELMPKSIMANFTGVLKVELSKPNPIRYSFYSIDNPMNYLDIEIDTVQMGNLEYQYHEGILKTQPITHTASAELVVQPIKIAGTPFIQKNKRPAYDVQLSMTLQNLQTKQSLFQNTWDGRLSASYGETREKASFLSFNECDHPDPNALLTRVLNIDQQLQNKTRLKKHFVFKVSTVVPENKVSDELKKRVGNREQLQNINCPPEIGLGYLNPYGSEKWLGEISSHDVMGTLQNHDVHYVFKYKKYSSPQLFCTEKNMYLYANLYSDIALHVSAINDHTVTPFGKRILLNRKRSNDNNLRFTAQNTLLVNVEEKEDLIQLLFYDQEEKHWINYQLTEE